ncbi:hypothetical protein [Rufibacter tibetensis]|uniref:hypothetical protein n=1 Tax=Rufibacter tibetensis TaxID=512763 RepID=UPI0012F7D1E4|nr:hypothetical protein [Rufibacter tibetensis]
MENIILSAIYALVPLLEKPAGYPVYTQRVSESLNLSVEELIPHLNMLIEGEYVKISPLHQPPLLSLTTKGVTKVERLCDQPVEENKFPLYQIMPNFPSAIGF